MSPHPDLELFVFDLPLDLAWFTGEEERQAQHWAPDIDMKWRFRGRHCGTDGIFTGWHNVESFALVIVRSITSQCRRGGRTGSRRVR